MKKIFNPTKPSKNATKGDITEYEIDSDFYTIKCGDTAVVPNHVADYLKYVYPFLKVTDLTEKETAEVDVADKDEKGQTIDLINANNKRVLGESTLKILKDSGVDTLQKLRRMKEDDLRELGLSSAVINRLTLNKFIN